MLLYWKNAANDYAWQNTSNWFEDDAGSVPHNALPTSGDSCTKVSSEWYSPSIGSGVTVDLGTGTCDIASLNNSGTISNGTFTGSNLSLIHI